MKNSEWIIYGLVVLFLMVLVWWLLPKNSKTKIGMGGDTKETGFVYMGKSDNSVKNEAGYVVSWEAKTEVLTFVGQAFSLTPPERFDPTRLPIALRLNARN